MALRGSHIKESWTHGKGAYARCSYCGRYSDDPRSLQHKMNCECENGNKGWCGSFVAPDENSKWSDKEVEPVKKKVAKRPDEPTRSQRRYQEYLRVAECYPSFAAYLGIKPKQATV